MIAEFERNISFNRLVNQDDKVLLAVSGGKDSMLMAWLFIQARFNVEIAHCNFNLRGEESDGDEDLVRSFAQENNIPFHVVHFDTVQYADQHKISIQMAARELRYRWFEELRQSRACDSIAIAQHKNDHVETVLFNLSRGTGLKGLLGIQQQRAQIIRPILFLASPEIAEIVAANAIPYRDDSSNFLNKYARNKIRLDIIPEFEKLNPDFVQIMDENIDRFQESVDVLDDFVTDLRNQLFVTVGLDTWQIEKSKIVAKKIGLLYLLFEPFLFSKPVLESLISSLDKESGRIFESEEYVLLVDREFLILKRKMDKESELFIESLEENQYQWRNYIFDFRISDDLKIEMDAHIAKLDIDQVIFPLSLRSWHEGDVFQPLGMKGKKKLSDLFIQRKVNVLDKPEVPILINGNGDIMWVVGFQLDDRYKITQKTKKVLKLVFRKK